MAKTIHNFSAIKTVYMIGIKGAGMAGLAQVLKGRNIAVSGSDTDEVFHTDASLHHAGITIYEQFSVDNVPQDADLVITSTAYTKQNNPEVAAALAAKLPLVTYPEALGMLLREKLGIAVAGSHGKTTITAMLSHVLIEAGTDPTAVVGAYVPQWQGNARTGKGQYVVIEADEYQNKFQYYDPFAVILANVDYDHPDFFPTEEAYDQTFRDFVAKVPRHGFLIACGEDNTVAQIAAAAECTVVTYGYDQQYDYQIDAWESVTVAPEEYTSGLPQVLQRFQVLHNDTTYASIELALPGKHNALNATAVVALCQKLGIPPEKVVAGLRSFAGTARRFEYKGTKKGVLYYDDYAHHPSEIHATLRAARAHCRDRAIWAVFHPHTFSRTKALLEDFARTLELADHVVVLDIYGSAREEQGGVSAEDLVDAINQHLGKAMHISTISAAAQYIATHAKSGDVVFTLGAGDVWQMHEMIDG